MLFLGPPVGTKRQFPASQKRFLTPFGIPGVTPVAKHDGDNFGFLVANVAEIKRK